MTSAATGRPGEPGRPTRRRPHNGSPQVRRSADGQEPSTPAVPPAAPTQAGPPQADQAPGGSAPAEEGERGHAYPARRTQPEPAGTRAPRPADADRTWDDGLIARRARQPAGAGPSSEQALLEALMPDEPRQARQRTVRAAGRAPRHGYSRALRVRLEALRELIGLSRTRLEAEKLAEAGRVLEEAAARHRLSLGHTVVALAGASGSGKSTLFNALAGGTLSEAGVRRPTTSAPVACTWSAGADGLLDRLGIPPHLRRRPRRPEGEPADGLRGLVLLDLPDHDSALPGRREQVDRLLGLVDAVVWVVDPEKYADAVLHERYLRPLAGYAEVTFVVLNQIDRLPGDAIDQVLDDLRRLLDEDGLALGEHGEPGATVLALSALTGDGVGELRRALARFSSEGGAAERRLAADVAGATARLRPAYVADGRAGLTELARAEFENRLADAVGAEAAGQAAERQWLRQAELSCSAPWAQLRRRYGAGRWRGRAVRTLGPERAGTQEADAPSASRAMVEQAVRTVADEAAAGLPEPWAQAVREAAVRGAEGLPEELDRTAAGLAAGSVRPAGPGWWAVAAATQALLLVLQVAAALWLVAAVVRGPVDGWLLPAVLMGIGVAGGPVLEWSCRMAARGPARRYGQEAERRLRDAAAYCGRQRVLEPVAAELLRYREVRDRYLAAAGGAAQL